MAPSSRSYFDSAPFMNTNSNEKQQELQCSLNTPVFEFKYTFVATEERKEKKVRCDRKCNHKRTKVNLGPLIQDKEENNSA